MILLGIDPGIARMGYGVISYDGNRLKALTYGCLETEAQTPLPERLTQIEGRLDKLMDDYQPDEVAFEELFFYQNKTNALTVAQARGVEILTVMKRGVAIYEFTPPQIKQVITGYGRADKTQMQRTVQALLQLKEIPQPDDAADGLCIAIALAFAQRFKEDYRME